MVEELKEQELDAVFHALANPTRRALIRRLTESEAAITELSRPHDMSFAAVSKHLQVLERAGLVDRSVRGREHVLTLRPDRLRNAVEWVTFYRQFWSDSLDRLGDLFKEESKNERPEQ